MSGGVKRKSVFIVLILLISTVLVFAPSVLAADTTPPTVTINFCGNHSDMSGPYYRPPSESTALSGANLNGYYANDSYQHESWMYLNLTVTDDVAVSTVLLHWYNSTTNKWFNTSGFVRKNTNYFEYNTSVNLTNITGGHKYSFDIWAYDTSSNINKTVWNKTGPGGVLTRRYVNLGCTPVNISYTPLYFYPFIYEIGDRNKRDRLDKDHSVDGSISDTGYLKSTIPTDDISFRNCTAYCVYGFNDDLSILPMTLNNIYFHIWQYNDPTGEFEYGWDEKRGLMTSTQEDDQDVLPSMVHANMNMSFLSHDYFFNFSTYLLSTTPTSFTDNSIYALYLIFTGNYPAVVSNRSFPSFVLLNVPGNVTLNASYPDSDSDGLSDWFELYRTYSNPFLMDSDADGFEDRLEYESGSDPNNYTDKPTSSLSYSSISSDSDFNAVHGVRYGSGTLADPYMICNWSVNNLSVSGTTLNFTISNCTINYQLLVSGLSADSKVVLNSIMMDGTGKGSLCYYQITHSNSEMTGYSIFKDLAYSYLRG